ncbi:MAG: hypothetical protein ACRDF0_09135 [Candidatus Limnocylindria bacterium]
MFRRRGLLVPEPRKRPRSAMIRFQADLPNECWQSDRTHRKLAGGQGVGIVNLLDDCSRLLRLAVAGAFKPWRNLAGKAYAPSPRTSGTQAARVTYAVRRGS